MVILSRESSKTKRGKKNELSAKDQRMKRFKEKRRHVLAKEFENRDNERIFKSKMTR